MSFMELVPAFTFTATVKLPIIFGTVAAGSTLTYADLVDGTFISEPGFSPAIEAKAIRGGDWITIDPSGKIMRLDLRTLLQTSDNQYIEIRATGVEQAIDAAMGIVTGVKGVPPVKYGDFQAVSSWSITTASEKYWAVQEGVYVGATSLRAGEVEGTFVVGFKISKVVCRGTDVSV